MYQLLFLVHGMGAGARPDDDPKWWTGVIDGVRKSAKTYGHGADFVFASPKAGQVLVVPLTYHDIFDTVRAAWTQESGSEAGWLPLLQGLAFEDPAALAKLPEWVQSAGEFFWTHVLDVLLYRYVADYTIPVRLQVADQIAEAWSKADLDNGTHTPVHFLAHSLGTAVLHDAISFLGADPTFGAGSRRITSMLTCANVSWVLENNFPAYTSIDRPVQAGGMTSAYFSFRHELDPIAEIVRTFRGDEHGWPPSAYRDRVTIEVKDWNVHGYRHYLDNPDVHLRLFERLWMTEPWATRRDPAMTAYRQTAGKACPMALAQARADLASVFSKPVPQTVDGFIDVVVRTVEAFSRARQACKQEGGE